MSLSGYGLLLCPWRVVVVRVGSLTLFMAFAKKIVFLKISAIKIAVRLGSGGDFQVYPSTIFLRG